MKPGLSRLLACMGIVLLAVVWYLAGWMLAAGFPHYGPLICATVGTCSYFFVVVEMRTRAGAGTYGSHSPRYDLGGSHRDEPDSFSCYIVRSRESDLLGFPHALGLKNEH